ncbi:hypothetical protein D3C71_1951080 [compost metagenome]
MSAVQHNLNAFKTIGNRRLEIFQIEVLGVIVHGKHAETCAYRTGKFILFRVHQFFNPQLRFICQLKSVSAKKLDAVVLNRIV